MTDLNGTTESSPVQPVFRRPSNSSQSHGDRLLVCKGLTRVWVPGPPPMTSEPPKLAAKLSFGGFEISLYSGPQKTAVKPTPAETGDAKPATEQKPYGLAWGPHNWATPKPADAKKTEVFLEELCRLKERKLQEAIHDSEITLSSESKVVAGVESDSGVPRETVSEAESSEKKSDETVTSPKTAPKRGSAFNLQSLKESLASKQRVGASAHLFNPTLQTISPEHPPAPIVNDVDGGISKNLTGAIPFSKEDAMQISARAPEGATNPTIPRNLVGTVPCSNEDLRRAWATNNQGLIAPFLPTKRSSASNLVTVCRPSSAKYPSNGMKAESSKKNRAGAPEMRGFFPRAKGKAPATSGSDQDDDGHVHTPTPGKVFYRPYFVDGDESFWVIDNSGCYVRLPIRDIVGRAGQWSNTSCGEPFFICKGQAVRKSDLKFFKSLREDVKGGEGA